MDENQALASMCKAMSVCPVHRNYILADINTMLLPPIRHKQYKFFEGFGQYGVVTWAFLNDQTAAKHIENRIPLTFSEWRSGEQLWIISLIGHNINPRTLLPTLADSFPHPQAHYIRRDGKMNVTKTVTIKKDCGRLKVSSQNLRKKILS
ncbi:toxin-activating lysine-acyltransferase [Thalassobius sp. I31.1]|uniref:toxin-activating lysine-acyltransferase n=1 Tax=Thalassobius sp. I31.1 TaxID=2109912 RepID=UPI000D1A362B|nr:toxin-activating lysine-acyltransferase [Thalassobius sp. I31.1]